MKFLVCGIGSIGERHIENLLSLGYRDIILYRRRNLPLRKIKQSFLTFNSINEALSEKPDVAIISNPSHLHISTALSCAKAGCHLFIEKPISHNFDDIEKLQEIINEKKLVVFIGFQFRFNPGLKRIKKLITQQTIGQIVYVTAQWGEYLPDWHPWEDYRTGYSALDNMGGGVILTLCHPFDYLGWLLGEISSVVATGGQLSDLQINVEDTVDVLLQFLSGTIGHVHLDYVQKPSSHRLQITGCKGMIKWDNADGNVLLYLKKKAAWETFPPPEKFERNIMFVDEMKYFIDCVKNKKRTFVGFNEGINALKIVMAAKRSMREEKTIYI